MSALVLFGSFFVLLLLTVPIGYAIGISSLIAIYYYSDIPLIIIAQKAITGVDSFPLLAIPIWEIISMRSLKRWESTAWDTPITDSGA